MGSDPQPEYKNNNNISQNKTLSFKPNSNINQINNPSPSNNEFLIPIRRHSNIYNSYNSAEIKIPNSLNSSLQFHKKNSQNIPQSFEGNKNRKLSEQYMENFKKSYLQEKNNFAFLNHLAETLNHGKQITYEDLEKFKRNYLPKYLLDWRNIPNNQTGTKCWKNFGKIVTDKVEDALNKIGNNTIKSNEPFYLRRCWFFRYLMKNYGRNTNNNPIVVVNKQNVFEESYNAFNKQSINLARPLNIRFSNENNEDEEGLYRIWYQSMFKDAMSPNKKLFLVNPYQTIEPNNIMIHPKYPGMKMEYYEFIGKFIIKTVVDMIRIRNFVINKFQLKLIKKHQIVLDDLKYYNLDLYQKLKYINDTTVTGNKQLESIRFIHSTQINGVNQEIELATNGKNISLNDQNKNIFISKIIYVEAIMPYEEQIKYIQKGLFQILGEGVQGVFTVEEMNFMLTGQEDIDLRDLKENIVYKGEYNENHPVIKMFWEKLVTLKKNELIKFLEFSTGSSAVPIDGFGSLKDIEGRIHKLTVEPFMDYSSENPGEYKFHKIDARKMYNTIILPKYRTKQELDNALDIVILNTN